MRRNLIIFGSLLLALCVASTQLAQSRRFAGNKEARAYTRDLQAIDKLELLKLKKDGDLWNGEIESTKTVEGADAQTIAALWRSQTYLPYSAICHFPAYGIKFYAKSKLVVFATLCWDCDNIAFETPFINRTQGFGGKDKKGQALLDVFRTQFPDKK